jgi:predicted phosphodiesterase
MFEEMASRTRSVKANHPAGFEPGAEVELGENDGLGQRGTAVVAMPIADAKTDDLLREAGFDPQHWVITGPIKYRKWMRYDQEWLHYYKFDIAAGVETPRHVAADVDQLVARIRSPRLVKPTFADLDDAWVYCASDWQIGKGEGDGTAGTVDRVLASIETAKKQITGLRAAGRFMGHGAFLASGDLGEGTCGFYPGMGFLIDCNRREQNKIGRELITHAIDELSPFFEKFTIATVAGNHGENRNPDGKKNTDNADNDDVALFEAVKEAFDRAGATGLNWIIPQDELSILVKLGGVNIGLTHGHLFTSGGKLPQAKALEWWKGQDFGMQPLRDAQILLSSHFHHFSAISHGWRTHFQTPAMDPGSKWVSDAWGSDSPAGVLTMRISRDEPLGFSDVQLLSAARGQR